MIRTLFILEEVLGFVKGRTWQSPRWLSRSLIIASVALGLARPVVAQAQQLGLDPRIEWKEIETKHFRVLFDSRHYELAKAYAEHAERSWQILAPVLRSFPEKTTVVLNDTGDRANGSASSVPYPTIFILPAPPEAGGSIADSGPWSFELIAHEYTHIANMEPSHGVMRVLRNVFGSIVRPNMMLPRWYLEGLAVELETRFSPTGGRLRSPNFTAIPRAMVEHGTLRNEDTARINETSIPDFPGGIRPYLMGALLMNEIAERDLSLVGTLNDHYARRIPFFISHPLKSQLDKDWDQLLDDVYTRTEERAQNQIKAICKTGCVRGEPLNDASFYSRSPQLSRSSNQLVYLARKHNRDTQIKIASGANWAEHKVLLEPFETNRVAWVGADRALLYDATDVIGERMRFELRTDLYVYDFKTKTSTRISRGLRAREAAINSANQVAFVRLIPGGTQIALGTLNAPQASGEQPASDEATSPSPNRWSFSEGEVLHTSKFDHRAFWPEWIDDTTLVFTERTPEGTEEIWVADLELRNKTQSSNWLYKLDLGGSAAFPRLVRHTREMELLFSSARSGITNIYSARLARVPEKSNHWRPTRIQPVTNSTTRAWIADRDPATRKLIYSRLDGDGVKLYALSEKDQVKTPTASESTVALPDVEPLFPRTGKPFALPEVSKEHLGDLEPKDYTLWPYLIPQYWMPYFAALPGGAFLSASTSSGDPMGRHSLAASLSTDTRIGKPNAALSYVNFTTPVQLSFLVDDTTQSLFASDTKRRLTTASANAQFYLPGLSNQWRGLIGVNHETFSTQFSTQTDVLTQGRVRAGISFQNLVRRGLEVAPENSSSFRLTHDQALAPLGGLVYGRTDLRGAAFFSADSHPKWLGWVPELHNLQLNAAVSYAPGLDRLLVAPSSVSVPIENLALGSAQTFLVRGYPSGSFLGRTLIKATAEYTFPIFDSFSGSSTSPFFRRRWIASVFADGVTVDGRYADWDLGFRRSELGQLFGAAGAEIKLEATAFYHLPMQIVFGLHYGFDRRINPFRAYPVIYFSL